MFDENPRVGLLSSDIPQSMLKTIINEDDMEEIKNAQHEEPSDRPNLIELAPIADLEIKITTSELIPPEDKDIKDTDHLSLEELCCNTDNIQNSYYFKGRAESSSTSPIVHNARLRSNLWITFTNK